MGEEVDWEEVAVANSVAVVEDWAAEVEADSVAAAGVMDSVAAAAVDSVAAADSAAEEDLLDFAAVMVEDGAAENGFLALDQEHAVREQHLAAVEEVQAIPHPRLEQPWVPWVAPASAIRRRYRDRWGRKISRTGYRIRRAITLVLSGAFSSRNHQRRL